MYESKTHAESAPEKVVGLLAEFDSSEAVTAAAEQVRDAGYTRWDVHSPYPIHGIEDAMGVRMTVLPWIVLGMGITGAGLGLLMQYWMNAVSYPFIISGKSFFSLPANIPITFECTILLASITTFVGMLGLNKLPQFFHPVFSSVRFRRATSDGYFISVEALDPRFNEHRTSTLLSAAGAEEVETLTAPSAPSHIPRAIILVLVGLTILLTLPPAFIATARATTKTQPRIHPIPDMDFQPKLKTQRVNTLFADGREFRVPVSGTVARGELYADDHYERGVVGADWAKTFPAEVPVNEATLERGHQRFNIYCAACHGRLGEGAGLIALRAREMEDPSWTPPVSLHASLVVVQPVGQLFNTITHGVRKMPPYGAQIPTADRWAILLYVRALQRSQNAPIADVPEELRAGLEADLERDRAAAAAAEAARLEEERKAAAKKTALDQAAADKATADKTPTDGAAPAPVTPPPSSPPSP